MRPATCSPFSFEFDDDDDSIDGFSLSSILSWTSMAKGVQDCDQCEWEKREESDPN